MSTKHIDALKLALEALERHAELGLLAGSTITAIREALVDSALDRMAENARELGLDYEPPCKTGSQCTSKCQQCEQPAQQQEPMAWMDGYRNIYSLEEKAAGCPEATIALVPMANHKKTSGSPINEIQCVCGAVWLGEEMVHLPDKRPPASKPWVGLTPEDKLEIEKIVGITEDDDGWMVSQMFTLTEAKLKEKNNG